MHGAVVCNAAAFECQRCFHFATCLGIMIQWLSIITSTHLLKLCLHCVTRRKIQTPGTTEEPKRQEAPTTNPNDPNDRQPTQLTDQAPGTIERAARESRHTTPISTAAVHAFSTTTTHYPHATGSSPDPLSQRSPLRSTGGLSRTTPQTPPASAGTHSALPAWGALIRSGRRTVQPLGCASALCACHEGLISDYKKVVSFSKKACLSGRVSCLRSRRLTLVICRCQCMEPPNPTCTLVHLVPRAAPTSTSEIKPAALGRSNFSVWMLWKGLCGAEASQIVTTRMINVSVVGRTDNPD